MSGGALRVAVDATPLLGARTGIGRYVEGLLHGLADLAAEGPDEVRLVPFTVRGAAGLRGVAGGSGPRVRARHVPIPARLLRAAWTRGSLPPVELLSGRVDVFHGTNFLLPPARRAAGVLTVHDLTYRHHPEWLGPGSADLAGLVARGLDRASAVCVPSAAVREELLAAYPGVVDPAAVHVTPLGVDLGTFRPLDPADVDRAPALAGLRRPYLVALGTLEPRKGLDTLVRAWERLGTGGPQLVLAGARGWASPGGGPDVLVPGYVPADVLPRLLAGSAGLLMPTRYEGFGLPVLEAMACGVPVAASDIPVMREVGGPHARYAPPGDVVAWAATVRALVAEPPGPAALAAARRHAAGFTWQRTARATLAAWRRATGPGGRRRPVPSDPPRPPG
jgi:glycosyltransferase involved in cell wall biosynthesis